MTKIVDEIMDQYQVCRLASRDKSSRIYHKEVDKIRALIEDAIDKDQQMDRHYKNGFMAGWNAAATNDEKLKKSVENRPYQ